jgi:hypothetical protein
MPGRSVGSDAIMARIRWPRCHAVLYDTPSQLDNFMALMPLELVAIRYMAMSQVRSGSFVLWRAASEVTE